MVEDYRKDDITYDENWQSLSENIVAKPDDNGDKGENKDNEPEKGDKKRISFVPLITIQLVVCLILSLVLFLLKAMDSNAYEVISSFYNEQMDRTLISDKAFENIDLTPYMNYFKDISKPATLDEI